MKNTLIISCAMLIITMTLANAGPNRLLAPHGYRWEMTPEEYVFATLEGDCFSETYQTLVRLPFGTVSSPQTKIANMVNVILQEEMIHHVNGENPIVTWKTGPGAFYEVESRTQHVSAFVSYSECNADLYQDRAFNFLPVQS